VLTAKRGEHRQRRLHAAFCNPSDLFWSAQFHHGPMFQGRRVGLQGRLARFDS